MKRSMTALASLCVLACLLARADGAAASGLQVAQADALLVSVENADVAAAGTDFRMTRTDHNKPVELIFKGCQSLGVRRESDQWWVLPLGGKDSHVSANQYLWLLPVDTKAVDHSWGIELREGEALATRTEDGVKVELSADQFTMHRSEARPHSDAFNHRYALDIASGHELGDALAAFYWGTMLPLVVEKTMAKDFPYSSGYVLSTLKVSAYAGSYPAVDHEFQIKGRQAAGSALDLDVVRRMIELQFRLMSDDPERLSRDPTSVQPDGRREYHILRNSKDNRQNAAMFPLTGNIEVLEEAWHYYEARKDNVWLRAHIGDLEHAATWIEASIDQYGRVWSDVYYEDQVIKDGRETQAQAFAAHSFELMAQMEGVLQRQDKAAHYRTVAKAVSNALIKPVPTGYWDEKDERFIDWIDRDGKVHDHIHLLANTLPVTFGYATAAQTAAVKRVVHEHAAEFERFPSFLSADIAGYDNSEIGDGGPYDLSAAGRYWYWDAAYREAEKQDTTLLDQLKMVAAEGAKSDYYMGERYDMDHVYYIDGKDAHGAEEYYEYPSVYAAVLISKYLGLTIPADADLAVVPHLVSYGSVEFTQPEYAVRYSYTSSGFELKNLAGTRRRFRVDLSALGAGNARYLLSHGLRTGAAGEKYAVVLGPQEQVHWSLVR